MKDQSWRSRTAVMPAAVVKQTAVRIAQAARIHRIPEVSVVLHGGEPLLAGGGFLKFAAAELRRSLSPDVRTCLSIQTNGVLLTRKMLEVLLAADIRIGVSLDGGPGSNDKHRRYADGRGSYHETARALELLQHERYRGLFGGILSVINLSADPIATFEALLAFEPPAVDFLLPHANWTSPPQAHTQNKAAPYAEWLITIFDRWYSSSWKNVKVRLFEEIIQLCLGGQSRSEVIGLSPVGLVVIETDGDIEQVDTLKSAFPEASATGLNIFRHDFDAVLSHPGVMARQMGVAALSKTCHDCLIHRICGSGYYPHRYQAGLGFRNPSVYCRDLYRLIVHIRDRVATDIRRLTGQEQ